MKVEAEADEKYIPNRKLFHDGNEEKEVDDSDDLDNVLEDVTPERMNKEITELDETVVDVKAHVKELLSNTMKKRGLETFRLVNRIIGDDHFRLS